MGDLFKLLLAIVSASLLISCTPNVSDIKDVSIESIEYISYLSKRLGPYSRGAAVKITSFDYSGGKISGTGAYVTHKGEHYIVTAAHVVRYSPSALIDGTNERIIAEVVFTDVRTDVAVLSIAGMSSREPVKWKVSKDVDIGTDVVYSGYPNMIGLLTIEGYVVGYSSHYFAIHSYAWGGASGSLVLDSRGRAVGVVSAVEVGMGIVGYPTIIEDIVLVAPAEYLEVFFK